MREELAATDGLHERLAFGGEVDVGRGWVAAGVAMMVMEEAHRFRR